MKSNVELSKPAWKILAGQAFHARIAGGLSLFVLANVVRREEGAIQRPIARAAGAEDADCD